MKANVYVIKTAFAAFLSISSLLAGCSGAGSSTSTPITKTTPIITWNTPAAVTVGTALSSTQLDATASVPGTFSYSPAAGTVLSTAGTTTLNATFTPTDTADYNSATASVSLTVTAITKTTPIITWNTPAAVTVGTSLSSTQLDAAASVPGTFSYSPAAGTVLSTAGTTTLNATFTPTDTTDYNSATASVSLTVTAITKTTPIITWNTPAAVTVGTSLSSTQLDATASVPGTFSYSPAAGTLLSTAGTTTLNATFTPTDTADYNSATASVSLTVNKATPTITWTAPASVPVGTALSSTQLDATASVPGSFSYSPAAGTVLSTAGTTTLNATFTPTDTADYNSATASVSLTVTAPIKTTPTITWASPAAVAVGTALSSTQLDATASVPGSFSYSPAAGTVESAVGTVTLSVTFTPTNTTEYNSASASVTLVVTGSTSGTGYSWSNVKIVAGGYVPGLYFHPKQQGLMYARTDMGGAYRWGPNDSQWVPLLDWISPATWWYGGPEAIGLDPTDPNRLYMAVGEYAAENWDSNGAMLVSDDQGNTFTTVPLSFKNGSNDNGRNAGERIAVDPNSPNIVYFGTRLAGLQISTDHGSTWNKATGLPVTTTANGSGVVSVVPITASGSSGSASPAVYVAVAGTGVGTDPVGLFVTTTGGSATSTWTAVAGQPSFATASDPMAPLHAILGPNGNLYVLYADGAGPNGISASQLWEFTPGSNWTSGTWRQITIPPNQNGSTTADAGYGGIAADPSHAGVLLLASIDDWWPGDTIYRSTNDGGTWIDVSAKGGIHDASLSPYLTFGSGSVSNVGSGNWVGSIVIDPFNSDHAMYGTGATIWSTTDLTNADASQTVDWSVGANGLEEASLGMAIAPPSGNTILLSGMGDIYGFAHTNLTVSPAQGMYSNPRYYPSDMDFEQNTPTTVVRSTQGNAASNSGGASNTPWGTISTNGGLTWTGFSGNPTWTSKNTGAASGGGSIAIAPDGSSIVWTPLNTASPWYSTNLGKTWSASTGLPVSWISNGNTVPTQVVSDRVAAGVFYGFAAGTLYISTNQGQTWTVAQSNLPTNYNSQTGCLVILPDAQGDLWLASGSGLYHNTGTATAPVLTAVSGVSSANYLSFGKAATGSSNLTLYLYGTLNNGSVSELYRSMNDGVTWTQINDSAHQWGGGVNSLTGDMRTFGTVYIGTNGRGIIWGTSAN